MHRCLILMISACAATPPRPSAPTHADVTRYDLAPFDVMPFRGFHNPTFMRVWGSLELRGAQATLVYRSDSTSGPPPLCPSSDLFRESFPSCIEPGAPTEKPNTVHEEKTLRGRASWHAGSLTLTLTGDDGQRTFVEHLTCIAVGDGGLSCKFDREVVRWDAVFPEQIGFDRARSATTSTREK